MLRKYFYACFFISSLLFFSCEPAASVDTGKLPAVASVVYDTIWSKDKSEYDLGKLKSGKQSGTWLHYRKGDTVYHEEKTFSDAGDVIRSRQFVRGVVTLDEYFLSDGVFNISYYHNGVMSSMGYHRTINGREGEQDGLWKDYDSTGTLLMEREFDFAHHRILCRKYKNGALSESREYAQEWGEASLFKNGKWIYYSAGKPVKTEQYQMELTGDGVGD